MDPKVAPKEERSMGKSRKDEEGECSKETNHKNVDSREQSVALPGTSRKDTVAVVQEYSELKKERRNALKSVPNFSAIAAQQEKNKLDDMTPSVQPGDVKNQPPKSNSNEGSPSKTTTSEDKQAPK